MSDRYPFIILSVFSLIFTVAFFHFTLFLASIKPLAALIPAFLSGLGGFWAIMSIAFAINPDAAKRQAR